MAKRRASMGVNSFDSPSSQETPAPIPPVNEVPNQEGADGVEDIQTDQFTSADGTPLPSLQDVMSGAAQPVFSAPKETTPAPEPEAPAPVVPEPPPTPKPPETPKKEPRKTTRRTWSSMSQEERQVFFKEKVDALQGKAADLGYQLQAVRAETVTEEKTPIQKIEQHTQTIMESCTKLVAELTASAVPSEPSITIAELRAMTMADIIKLISETPE